MPRVDLRKGWGTGSDTRRRIRRSYMHGHEELARWEVWIDGVLMAECAHRWMAQLILDAVTPKERK